ncbi:MAG: hypothetical protein IJ297_04765, partial [Clostridia bacterium]|nr:hypothetical protein [Clostridia bacterium]
MATNIPINQVFTKVYFDTDDVNGIVTDMVADKFTRSFVINVTFKSVVSAQAMERYCEEIKKCYKAEHVQLIPTYDIENPTEENILKATANCVYQIGSETPFYKALFDSCEYEMEDTVVKIHLRHMNIDYLKDDKIDKRIEKELSRALDINVQIEFIDSPMDIETTLDPIYDTYASKPKTVELTEDEPILGKTFEVKGIMPMDNIDEGSGEVCVKGNVFTVSSRYLEKSDKYIVSFYIT